MRQEKLEHVHKLFLNLILVNTKYLFVGSLRLLFSLAPNLLMVCIMRKNDRFDNVRHDRLNMRLEIKMLSY